MKITELSTKPQLLKIILNDKQTKELYGDDIEFYIWDRQPLDKFAKFASVKPENIDNMLELCGDLILDESGEPVMKDGNVLPNQLLVKCVNKVVEQLGK